MRVTTLLASLRRYQAVDALAIADAVDCPGAGEGSVLNPETEANPCGDSQGNRLQRLFVGCAAGTCPYRA